MMTNRRTFLGGVLAASALGGIGLARKSNVRPARPATVEFYSPSPGEDRPGASGQILGNLAGQLGTPESVDLRSVEVGHFHGLMHEGGGRIAYLYEATIPGPCPRRGFVKLGDTAASASA
jgi:hypothetical protein